MGKTLKQDIAIQTAKAAPAVFGFAASSITLNGCVAVATLIYVLVQTAYLIWKWRKEVKKGRDDVSS